MKTSSFFRRLSGVDEVRVKKAIERVWYVGGMAQQLLMSRRTGYLTKLQTDNRERVWVFQTNHVINTTDGSNHKHSLIFIDQSVRLFSLRYSSALSSAGFFERQCSLPFPISIFTFLW